MDDSYYGKIIVADSSNQDMNKVILIQMKKRNNKTLCGGTYYDASIGHEYEAKIKIKDSNTIRFTGFYGFFNKINFWKRIRKNKIPKPNK